MLYEVAEIVKDIRIALDQNNSSAPLLDTGDIDTLLLDELIESKIADAARAVANTAPVWLLEGGKDFADSVGWMDGVGNGGGFIHLPSDYLRLVSFQMSDWVRSVSSVITEEHPLYSRQSSRYPGIRGNPQNPIVALVTYPVGLCLEFYSCTGGEHVYIKRARYIPIPKIEDGHIDICEKLRPSTTYNAASLVAQSIGHADLAATLLNFSNELLK